jgi:hypothetical protein
VQDAYIFLNRFWGSRKNANVAQLCALYSDLDYHNVPDLSDRHPLGIVELAFEALEGAKIPRPSLAVATGRGLALYWVFYEPVPGAALSRWRLCQDRILEAMRPFGSRPCHERRRASVSPRRDPKL